MARVRCHIKRRGYWGEGIPASFKIHLFFPHTIELLQNLHCSFYQRFYAYHLSSLLHRLRCIMPDYAACIYGQKSCVTNRCATERLRLFCKDIIFAECSDCVISFLLKSTLASWSAWSLAKQLGDEATTILSASLVRTDWKLLFLSSRYNRSELTLIAP